MRDNASRYCVVAVYMFGKGAPSLLSAEGKVIVFDTPEVAREWLSAPEMQAGREARWSPDRETCVFLEMRTDLYNQAQIWTGYDPYNVPANIKIEAADGRKFSVGSEARFRPWRKHVMWSAVFFDVGQMQQRRDGSWANTALGQT